MNSSPTITGVINSRRMRWAMYAEAWGITNYIYKILVRKHDVKDQFGDLGTDGRVLLKHILKK
jgi:hypothetical protein